jgi:hypothetical protein
MLGVDLLTSQSVGLLSVTMKQLRLFPRQGRNPDPKRPRRTKKTRRVFLTSGDEASD